MPNKSPAQDTRIKLYINLKYTTVLSTDELEGTNSIVYNDFNKRIKNSLEKTLGVGNVVVPSGFVGNQCMEGKVGW